MNDLQIKEALAIVKAAYPSFHAFSTPTEMAIAIKLWQRHFKDVTPDIFNIAVNKWIGNETKPPCIADLKGRRIRAVQAELIATTEDVKLIEAIKLGDQHG